MIIGITGRAAAGKDTICGVLITLLSELGIEAKRFAFAEKLKEVVAEMYDVPVHYFHDRDLKNVDHSSLSPCSLMNSINEIQLEQRMNVLLIDLYGVDFDLSSINVLSEAKRIFVDLLPEEGCSPRKAAQLIGTEGFRTLDKTTWTNYTIRQAQEIARRGGVAIITDVRFGNENDAIRNNKGVIVGIENSNAELYNHASEAEVDELVKLANLYINNDGTFDDLLLKSKLIWQEKLIDRMKSDWSKSNS